MSVNEDPYVYSGTNILKNKYDLKIKEDLETLEGDFTALRLREIALASIKGQFDFAHVCAIHEYIFQDVYEWAGSPRTINIEKPEAILSFDSVIYADAENIESAFEEITKQMRSFDWKKAILKDTVTNFSKFYARLWRIHPFREGNTRAITEFMCEYAQAINKPLERELLQTNSEYLRLSLVASNAHLKGMEDKSNTKYLEKIIADAFNQS